MSSITNLDEQQQTAPSSASSAAPAAPARAISVERWVFLLELLLILLVVRLFRIEERRGLFELLLLALLCIPVYRRLPLAWRPAIFLAISLASFPLAFAWPHVERAGWLEALTVGATQSAWVVAIGGVLFGLCHLPMAFFWRVLAIAGAAAGLVYWRSDAISPFWAVLGSMFMFRLWIYLRELRRERKPVCWSRRLSYFFLLPNAFFPFFPIVDYRRFRDGFTADANGAIAQRGVAWILRGIMHLLLYRAVKIYLLPTPIDLIDIEYVALFLVTNYALYLQISGHFHIITGLLHLFGFDLPRTHDRYFLASSLSDIWRRINIYWKDFLTEHVFYPAFFTLRRLPKPAAIVIAVGMTFVATWLLHSWQAFWLLGDLPIATRDAALWISAGSLVAISSLWQYHAALKGVRKPIEVTPASALVTSLKVVGTFTTVSFFWACWTVPKFPQLVYGVAMTGGVTPRGVAVVGGTILAVVTAGTLLQLATARLRRDGVEPSLPLERSPMLCAAAMGLLVLVGMPEVHERLGHDASQQVASLQHEVITADEERRRLEGYYEDLAAVNLQSDPLFSATNLSSARQSTYFDAVRRRDDILERELIPGWMGEVEGQPFVVNRWGMRDDDVPRRKPPNICRIAVLGSSVTMGYGVRQDMDFESLLEKRMNAEARTSDRKEYELMNFAAGGYFALHSAIVLREKVFPFEPDAVFYVAHQSEYYDLPAHLGRCNELELPFPYPCLDAVLRSAGVQKGTSSASAEILLEAHAEEVASCVYRGIVDDCRRRHILPVWIYIPMPKVQRLTIDGPHLVSLARDAGFVVIDLSDWANGYKPGEVKFGELDIHASAVGHRVIADRLLDALHRHSEALPRSCDED